MVPCYQPRHIFISFRIDSLWEHVKEAAIFKMPHFTFHSPKSDPNMLPDH